MGRRRVLISVDEGFFNTFEKERKKEQDKLRTNLGLDFNLTQTKFTEMLDARKFKFQIPKQRRIVRVRKIKRKRRGL